jgi:toxin ParE1/3/4
VAAFRFSRRAEADLQSIAEYTLRAWGEAQTARYLSDLENCCGMLAHNPGLGRSGDGIRSGLRRMEHEKHIVFYRLQKPDGILVVRILHRRTLPEKQAFEDSEGS